MELDFVLLDSLNWVINILALAAILEEVVFILTFFNCRRLRKDKSFIILFNFSVIHICTLLLTLSYIHHDIIKTFIHNVNFYATMQVLILGLACISLVKLFRPNYKINVVIVILLLFIIYLLLIIDITLQCIYDYLQDLYKIYNLITKYVDIIFEVVVVIYDLLYVFKKGINNLLCKMEIEFLLTNIYFIHNLPMVIFSKLVNSLETRGMLITYYILIYISLLQPLSFLIILYNFCNNFKSSFNRIFCCKKNNDLEGRVLFSVNNTTLPQETNSELKTEETA